MGLAMFASQSSIPQMFAQRRAGVVTAKQPARLQHGHHGTDKLLEHTRHQCRCQDKSVAGMGLEQILQLVRNSFRRSHNLRTRFAGGETTGGLAERQVLRLGALQDNIE